MVYGTYVYRISFMDHSTKRPFSWHTNGAVVLWSQCLISYFELDNINDVKLLFILRKIRSCKHFYGTSIIRDSTLLLHPFLCLLVQFLVRFLWILTYAVNMKTGQTIKYKLCKWKHLKITTFYQLNNIYWNFWTKCFCYKLGKKKNTGSLSSWHLIFLILFA